MPLAMILAACGLPAELGATPTPAATEIAATADSNQAGIVVASAKVLPAQEVHISFAVSAPVKEVMVAEGDMVKVGQALATLYAPDLEGAVLRAEIAEKTGELEYQYWIPHRFNRPPERKQQAQAEWDQLKMALEVARASFAQTTIYAPFDGTVVDVGIKEGELAQTGRVVVTLADLAKMLIETTDLSERDIVKVKIGQVVDVYVEALDVTVTGKVSAISPVSKTVGGDVVYPVKIALDEQPKGLLWGMSTEVTIYTK